jgi:hypothetical protein
LIESPSEEEEDNEREYDEDKVALFIQKVQQVHQEKKTL